MVAAIPFVLAYAQGVSFEKEIDPTLLNGLLTGSSILFGFSSAIIFRYKPVPKDLKVVLLIPLFLIGIGGTALSGVAKGVTSPVWALLILQASIYTSLANIGYLLAEIEKW